MMEAKPIASLSFDLDNQWSYMKTHGDPGWESFPSYLDIVVPRVLEFLRDRNLTITFFIVGQDAALEKNHAAIQSIAAAGHEIGNHSFNHEPWLGLYTDHEIELDVAHADEYITLVTGRKPVGFRGPGYSLSGAALLTLMRRGYLYDASTLPTFIGPLARTYYFASARLSPEEQDERRQLFGGFRDGFRPNRAHRLKVRDDDPEGGLLEIPVTTVPLIRTPFHSSYVLYMSRFSWRIGLAYLRTALLLCRLSGVQPSCLLHPLDVLGYEDAKGLSFFPAMDLPRQEKTTRVGTIIDLLAEQFHVVTLQEHARSLAQQARLPSIRARFSSSSISAMQESSS